MDDDCRFYGMGESDYLDGRIREMLVRMREDRGDILTYQADAIVIPTNTVYRMKNKNKAIAVMGAGLAKQAALKWPQLVLALGANLMADDWEHPFVHTFTPIEQHGTPIVFALPTKRHYRDESSLELISSGLDKLVHLVNTQDLKNIAVPRLGCGLGNLDWDTEVKPLMESKLDDRFVVVYPA
jgi:O-acetyl-ADP-ribose deacetylase (regulator of RNase III)